MDQDCGSGMEESLRVSGGDDIKGWNRSADRSNKKGNSE